MQYNTEYFWGNTQRILPKLKQIILSNSFNFGISEKVVINLLNLQGINSELITWTLLFIELHRVLHGIIDFRVQF